MFSIIWGICFSLNANPNAMKTFDFCTVRAQSFDFCAIVGIAQITISEFDRTLRGEHWILWPTLVKRKGGRKSTPTPIPITARYSALRTQHRNSLVRIGYEAVTESSRYQ